ncbi:hypothetical protein [Sphingomonas sp.]|uniref:hypothetical protein n=1 Tax=Sphingomonas sp. TaxID=28214 RepID=UPI001B1BA990|nr:hypothetical protein [Sphingomonas sp.]MBO9714496.1 hypothetical protein [Sphingomonas sp.]
MSAHLAALLMLAVVIPGAFITQSDFRQGRSRFWLSPSIVRQWQFDRAASPTGFWVSTAVNVALIALLVVVGILILIRPDHIG